MTPEQSEDFGRTGRFVHRLANVKLVTLLAIACVVMGISLVALTTVTGIALLDSANQKNDINELRIENNQLSNRLTNTGARLNELQIQIDQLVRGK